MTSPTNKSSPSDPFAEVQKFSSQLEGESKIVDKKLGGFGRFRILKRNKNLPDWAKNYIQKSKELEKKSVDASVKSDKKIPEEIRKQIAENNKRINKIAKRYDYSQFVKAIQPQEKTVGSQRLLTPQSSQATVTASAEEWHLNLGLLMNVYKRTEDPEMKKLIGFLAAEYLAKAAPPNFRDIGLSQDIVSNFEQLFQLGAFQDSMTYHRENSTFEKYLLEKVNREFVPSSGQNALLMDQKEISPLLAVRYTVAEVKQDNLNQLNAQIEPHIRQHFERHLQLSEGYSGAFSNPIDPPLLLDMTAIFEQAIRQNNPKNDEEFRQLMADVEKAVDQAIDQVIASLQKDTQLCVTDNDRQLMRVYLRSNLTAISRHDVKGLGVIKRLPLFMDSKHFLVPAGISSLLGSEGDDPEELAGRLSRISKDRSGAGLTDFLNLTGTRIGGVNGRAKIFEFIDFNEFIDLTKSYGTDLAAVEYTGRGENVMYFETPQNLVNKQFFQRMKQELSVEMTPANTAQIVMGRSALMMVEGLMNKISSDQWKQLNDNPETRQLVQTSLYRLMINLSKAENHLDDFSLFSQHIELVFCELTTLLTLLKPYQQGDYEKLVAQNLSCVPEGLRPLMHPGISKSAMNTFGGILSAVKQTTPNPQIAHCSDAYYEEIGVVGENRTTQAVLANRAVQQVDLYLGQFNPNINIDRNATEYHHVNVIQEVEQLLKTKGNTQNLTVAIDNTIDFVNSEDVQKVLTHFEKEIKEGKLNFVIFRSGQKFDMLGMDNFYGAPFYVINNGGDQWKHFNRLFQEQCFETDSLSTQWFSLMNEFAPQATDLYRGQIFKESRRVLSHVPDSLKPEAHPKHVRVNVVDDGMLPCFIDIKLVGDQPALLADRIEKLFYQKYAERGIQAQSRASFGFYYPNINLIRDQKDQKPRNFRINPGLNAADNDILISILQELPKLVAELDG